MEIHFNNIAIPLLAMARSTQFSISLPDQAIEMIEKGLIPSGLFGIARAEVCRALILDMLKQQHVREIVREHMTVTD